MVWSIPPIYCDLGHGLLLFYCIFTVCLIMGPKSTGQSSFSHEYDYDDHTLELNHSNPMVPWLKLGELPMLGDGHQSIYQYQSFL